MAEELGRILFPGNPWPNGHAIIEFEWTGRFLPNDGIWFDLHLKTDMYYAEDDRLTDDDDEEDDDIGDWESKVVWSNYHSCTISSTYWIEDAERHWEENRTTGSLGVKPASSQEPLDLRRAVELEADPLPSDPWDFPRPFGIYLTGHDAVARHTIRIRPKHDGWSFEWSGLIALIYGGQSEWAHEFNAVVPSATFGGIRMPRGTSTDTALSLAAPVLAHPDDFSAVERQGEVWLQLAR